MGGLQEDSDKLQESQRQFAGQAMYMGMYILLFCKSTANLSSEKYPTALTHPLISDALMNAFHSSPIDITWLQPLCFAVSVGCTMAQSED